METPATHSALIGAPVLLLVAEPWDFTSPYGRGRLEGQISNIRDFGPACGQELNILLAPLIIAGRLVEGLRATPLHLTERDLVRRLLDRRPTAVRLFGSQDADVRLVAAIRRLGPARPVMWA